MFDISAAVLSGQLMVGLINGAFYALMSLGLAIIFGLLHVINFAQGAQYMMGAVLSWILLTYFGVSYWWSLLLAPLLVGLSGVAIERLLLRRLYAAEPIYGLLLTLGLALVIESVFRHFFGATGLPYANPIPGGQRLPFMFVPNYRIWVVGISLAVCLVTWIAIEKTKFGSYLRAATERADLVRAFGVNVPLMVTLTYGFGAALAAFAGVLAAPIYSVNPLMGSNFIIVVFAVVVIGGMGSILGAVVTGYALGIVEGLSKVIYPEGSSMVIFAIMVLVLMVRPNGLFGIEP